nr:protein crowded nuclei 2-like [Tanacetum cinerariifolium]GEZ40158.1 protein crowded nuclei 2-like [Tanacetum cinerariifolium]
REFDSGRLGVSIRRWKDTWKEGLIKLVIVRFLARQPVRSKSPKKKFWLYQAFLASRKKPTTHAQVADGETEVLLHVKLRQPGAGNVMMTKNVQWEEKEVPVCGRGEDATGIGSAGVRIVNEVFVGYGRMLKNKKKLWERNSLKEKEKSYKLEVESFEADKDQFLLEIKAIEALKSKTKNMRNEITLKELHVKEDIESLKISEDERVTFSTIE